MANKIIPTLGSEISIPTALADFKSKPQVVWTGSTWVDKPTFTPTHGFTQEFKNDGQPISAGSGSGNLYTPNETDGIDFSVKSQTYSYGNTETKGDVRWMPANVFNGCGFEVRQNHDTMHSIYLKHWCVIFANRSNNNTRFWGVDTGANDPYAGYRYIRFPESNINNIRNWGPTWLLQGFIFNFATNGGLDISGQVDSAIRLYNLKVGHKFSEVSDDYRYIPSKRRSFSERNNVNAGFSDPFS